MRRIICCWNLLWISVFYFAVFFLFAKEFASLSDETTELRRNMIRSATQSAWREYKTYAWGYDFLAPQSHSGKNLHGLGYSIVDSLDTLLLMNLTEEFNEAEEWVRTSFVLNSTVSVFEATIRCIGALITTYEQTQNTMFLKQAQRLGDKLLPAFNTVTGLPRTLINLSNGKCYDHDWSLESTILADAGSIQMEFLALSEYSGNPAYWDAAKKAMLSIRKIGHIPTCLIPYNYLNGPINKFSLDAEGDSYFEMLLKLVLYAKKNVTFLDGEFKRSIKAALKRLSFTSRFNKLQYFATVSFASMVHTVSHLSFFLPGTLFLAESVEPDEPLYGKLADQLLKSAKFFYSQSTGLSGDNALISYLSPGFKWADDAFKLRPEYVESLFYLWRTRKDPWARKEAWRVFESLLTYTSFEGGFTTIHDTYCKIAVYEDTMDSYFLSETLKYLYLIFSPDNLIPLSNYVFTTQAHFFKKRNQ